MNDLQKDVNYWTEEKKRADDLHVTVYWKDDFEGDTRRFGLIYVDYVGDHWNDEICSIRVPYGLKIIIYEHSGYRGRSLTLTSNRGDLDWYRNETSSLKVFIAFLKISLIFNFSSSSL